MFDRIQGLTEAMKNRGAAVEPNLSDKVDCSGWVCGLKGKRRRKGKGLIRL